MAVITYKCPNCDGELTFDPQTQSFVCVYCKSSFGEAQLRELTPDQARKQADPTREEAGGAEAGAEREPHGAVVYACPSCGAEIVTDETTASTYCFYCHNPVTLSGRLEGAYRPDFVIPFAIEREAAVANFLEWTGKKRFIPRNFFSKEQIERITGVYFPYWFTDSDLCGKMTAHATTVRTWRTGDTEHTETSHFRLVREGTLHFTDLLKPALGKADRRLVESVQPFDNKGMREFSMAYLSGFQAEKRDIEQKEVFPEIKKELEGYSESFLRDSMQGFATVVPETKQIDIAEMRWRYALLPVWTVTYKGKDKMYYYAMNGQTGKVCGELPVSARRILALGGIIAAVLMILLTIGGYFL